MMQTAQIEVQYVNPRKDNRPPSIKDTQGNYYTLQDAALPSFQQGMQGTIGFSVNSKGFKNAVSWNGQELPQGFNTQPQQQSLPQPAQAAMATHSNGADKEEGMFVMGVVGRAMGSGAFGVNDVDLLTKAAVEAWKNRHCTAAPLPDAPTTNYPEGYAG